MNRDLDPIEAAVLAAMALAWAVLTALRLVLVPAIALVVVLVTPRRCPAPEPAPMAPEPPAVAAEPVLMPVTLAAIAAGLEALPAAELRAMAGTRRRLPKHALVAQLVALPI